MWKLCVEDDQGNKTTVNLVRDEYAIGRAQENTVRLTERNISRRHAVLKKNGAGWHIEDQSSYNGCFVNGARVCDPQPLDHGDLVQLGDYRLRVVNESAEVTDDKTPPHRPREQSAPAPVPTDPAPPADRLIMLVGPNPGAEFVLEPAQVLIGRGEECDISINDGSVSRVHAEIKRLEGGAYELVDRGSANGVRVNGNDLKQCLLESHDTIEFGDIVLKFVTAGETYIPHTEVTPTRPKAAALSAGKDRRPSLTGRQIKILGMGAAAVLIGVVGFAALSGGGDQKSPEAAVSAEVDAAAGALAEAKTLLAQGDVAGAHQKLLAGVPAQSTLRDSVDFRAIESAWAQLVLAQAAKETDPDQKRSLYDQLARSTTVPMELRRRAADELSLLRGEGVDIADLPQAKPDASRNAKSVQPSSDDPYADTEAPSAPGPAAVATAPRAPKPTAPAEDDPYREPAAAPAPAAPEPKAPGVSTGTSGRATSGDRSAQIAVKDSLKAKVASGRATEQEKRLLRALCRQYSDMSCAN